MGGLFFVCLVLTLDPKGMSVVWGRVGLSVLGDGSPADKGEDEVERAPQEEVEQGVCERDA